VSVKEHAAAPVPPLQLEFQLLKPPVLTLSISIVVPVETVVRVRTGERGADAL